PRHPIPLRPLESMRLRPVDAEVDRRIVRVAVLVEPTAQELALQNPATWIHPRIAQELDVEEYLPRIPTLGDLDQLAAYVGRRLVEKPVQVLVLYQRVREQENEVVCSVLLGNPLARHPRPYAARAHDNVLPLLHPPHRLRLGLAKQRCLPRAFLLPHKPQDGPSNGLRSLPRVVSQRLLIARILLPLPLLPTRL